MDWIDILRFLMTLLGLGAMGSLWIARRDRGGSWTKKMRDIWWCHFIVTLGVVQSNFEFLLREKPQRPTIGILLFMIFLGWTIKGTFNGEMYTKQASRDSRF